MCNCNCVILRGNLSNGRIILHSLVTTLTCAPIYRISSKRSDIKKFSALSGIRKGGNCDALQLEGRPTSQPTAVHNQR